MRRFFALVFAAGCAASLPAPIADERARTPPGQITVVEYVDFECPFCRRLNGVLAPALAKYEGRVRVVRKHVPLVKIHPHAEAAARASVCADAQGKGDAMAEALFRAPPDALVDESNEALAAQLGIETSAFHACLSDAKTRARVRADDKEFDAVGGQGVPLVFIGAERYEGMQDAATIEASLERAARDVAR